MTAATTPALHSLHLAHGAHMGEVRGEPIPEGYGDLAAEVASIKQGFALLDMEPGGVLLIRGPDAEIFLNGLVTNDLKRLAEGQAHGSLLCANKGKVLYAVVIARARDGQFLLLTEPGEREGVAGHLDGYHIREDVEIGRVPLVRLDLLGPSVAEGLRALGHDVAQPIGSYREAPLLLLSLPLGALPRVVALLPAPHAAPWAEALLAAAPGARLVGTAAYDEARIRAGVPAAGVDFGREELPAEAALFTHIAFNKGCYVGQEVHARLHYRGHVNRKLSGLAIPEEAAAALAPGAELFCEGTAVGRLTSLTRLPQAGERRGIAMVRWQTLQEGTLLAAAADGAAVLRPVPLATDLGPAAA